MLDAWYIIYTGLPDNRCNLYQDYEADCFVNNSYQMLVSKTVSSRIFNRKAVCRPVNIRSTNKNFPFLCWLHIHFLNKENTRNQTIRRAEIIRILRFRFGILCKFFLLHPFEEIPQCSCYPQNVQWNIGYFERKDECYGTVTS